MAEVEVKPTSMTRPKKWSEEVEENYRFQLAGYRDAQEYKTVKGMEVCNKIFGRLCIVEQEIEMSGISERQRVGRMFGKNISSKINKLIFDIIFYQYG